MKNVIN